MTGRDPEKMLRAEARRFPQVAELLARVEYLTDEEIDYAAVPLPWYRSALKSVRDKAIFAQRLAAMGEEMENGSCFRHGRTPPVRGKMGLFVGQDQWVKMIYSDLLLRSGTLVFFPRTGGIWVESAVGPNAKVDAILPYCRDVQDITLDEYKCAFNQRQLSQCPDAPMTIDLSKSAQSMGVPSHLATLASLGVRIG